MKSAKHTQLPVMQSDCQIEQPQHTRTAQPISGMSSPLVGNCGINDSRHLNQLISEQEPPEGDETDPDVIPNQYGKFHC